MSEGGEGEAPARASVVHPVTSLPVTEAALGASAVELADREVRGHRLDLPLEPRQQWVQLGLGRVGGEGHGRILKPG